jgi:hypothetical protein
MSKPRVILNRTEKSIVSRWQGFQVSCQPRKKEACQSWGICAFYFSMALRLAFRQRSEITQTSVAKLNKRSTVPRLLLVTNSWLISVGLG